MARVYERLGEPSNLDQALGERVKDILLVHLIARSSEGILRRARNLALASLLEAVRDRTKAVDLKQVNRVLMQPHWRRERDIEK